MRRLNVRCFFAFLLSFCGFFLVVGASVEPASAQEKHKKIPATFQFQTWVEGETCRWQMDLQFPSMEGATGYLLRWWDGFFQEMRSAFAPPFVDRFAKEGSHRIGLTGGSHHVPCDYSGLEAALNVRFNRRPKAIAIFPLNHKPKPEIWGTVSVEVCDAQGTNCKNKGLAGVNVVATPVGPGTGAGAATDLDGEYRIRVKKGQYQVKPFESKVDFEPQSQTVTAQGFGPRDVDFAACEVEGQSAGSTRAVSFCRILQVAPSTSPDHTVQSVHFVINGVDWKPNGGPIRLTFDGEQFHQVDQTAAFKTLLLRNHWNHRSNVGDESTFIDGQPVCSGELVGKQGSNTRTVPLKSRAFGVVLATDNEARVGKQDVLCYGEENYLRDTVGTIVAEQMFSPYLTLIKGDGTFLTEFEVQTTACVPLHPSTRGSLRIIKGEEQYRVKKFNTPDCSSAP